MNLISLFCHGLMTFLRAFQSQIPNIIMRLLKYHTWLHARPINQLVSVILHLSWLHIYWRTAQEVYLWQECSRHLVSRLGKHWTTLSLQTIFKSFRWIEICSSAKKYSTAQPRTTIHSFASSRMFSQWTDNWNLAAALRIACVLSFSKCGSKFIKSLIAQQNFQHLESTFSRKLTFHH